ncbi:MAG: mandelate racemase/muconate lactonizing protein [Acidobacteria bacterium]|nr:mandelate racemase/muconate lactonizing protein [Acidobacteriota bacterium]
MKITAVEAYPVSISTRPEVSIISSLGEHRVSRYVLVRIRTDNGLVGYGEASVMPIWSGETQAGALAAIREVLAPVLAGRDPLETAALADAMDRVLVANPFTKAALEMALLDLAGKALDAPVNTLLGGPCRAPQIPLKFSIGAFPPAQAARVAESAAEQGLRAVKVKVGLDPAQDIVRLEAVRSALGDGFRIAVDANGGWSESDALAAIPGLERLGVNALEQPLGRGDFAGSARLRRRTSIPVLLDESIFTTQDALEAIRADACDLISIYPGKNGGLRRSLEIAHLASAAGLPCVIGSNLEWEIGSAAMLHLAVAVPNLARTVDHDIIGPLYHTHGAGRPPIQFQDGCAFVPEGSGLGVEIDPAVLGEGNVSAIGK